MQERVNPIAVVRAEAQKMEAEFQNALPAHIPVERFMRVVMTAIQQNGDLLNCSRRSLWNAAMRAAQDGLLPDGREGAIVPYKGEAQWMPMIGGIRKKVRNSGEIATWDVHAVHEHDAFDFELGDDPYIKHKPALGKRGRIVAVYSVATLKSGEKSRDVMSIDEVEAIRAKSRSKNGPWADPTFYPEMAKKTVARRHAKQLPMSSDLDDLIRRDDDLYDLDASSSPAGTATRASLTAKLQAIAAPSSTEATESPTEAVDADTGEITDIAMDAATEAQEGPDDVATAETQPDPLAVARERGADAFAKGMARRAVPPEYRDADRQAEAEAWVQGFDAAKAGGAQ